MMMYDDGGGGGGCQKRGSKSYFYEPIRSNIIRTNCPLSTTSVTIKGDINCLLRVSYAGTS